MNMGLKCPCFVAGYISKNEIAIRKMKNRLEAQLPEMNVIETVLLVFKRSPIHGTGGFAKTAIVRGTRVIEYVGNLIDKRESLRQCEAHNDYIFALNEEHDLDGSVAWNPARFINHSCTPNCSAEIEDARIWIVANRDVQPGEEITFNYGFDLEDYRQYPCQCGSPDCIGYIVDTEFFEHIRKQRAT